MHASKSKMKSSFKVEVLKQVNHAMPEMHYHDFFEIYIQDQGERDQVVSNKYYKLGPRDVLLMKPNVLHQSISDNPHTRTIVYFTEDLLKQYFSEKMCSKLLSPFEYNVLTLSPENYHKVYNIVRDLGKETLSDEYNHIFTKLADLLLILALNIEQLTSKKVPVKSQDEVSISPLVSYIHENYLVLENITEIADTFYMTKSHLCRTFKKLTGYTIIQYINNLKVQQACYYLHETNKTINEIALDCGFNSTMYFCRIFKDILNITPTEYRKI